MQRKDCMITLTPDDIYELMTFVKANYGIDLTTKKTFVETRVRRQMALQDYTEFPPFFANVCMDATGERLAEFISALTVNYTLFNREAEHFDYLVSTVLPKLTLQEQADKVLRVWSAGCATGEEPYTLAMIMNDFFNLHKPLWDTTILATDISTVALKKAEEGVYALESTAGLNGNWLKYYFSKIPGDSDLIRIAPGIKHEVIFRKHNLVGPPFQFKKKFHFIFCRNVMIYFDEKTKTLLLNRFYDVLEDGGYLFIGLSETLTKDAPPFTYVHPSIYRKEKKRP